MYPCIRIQKAALAIIFGLNNTNYEGALWISGLQSLKGEFSSQTCGLNMIAKVFEMNRKNFFFHFLFSTSAGSLAGLLVLA